MVLIKEQKKIRMDVMWKKFSGVGLEHLFLSKDDENIKVDSVILTMREDVPVHIFYNICCDLDWKVRRFDIYNYNLRPVNQRYTCLNSNINGYKYRYENLNNGFTAEFFVDKEGFVIDYPDLFKRVYNIESEK
ncbi:putative glycolipid-binding domain-containing protein [Clostridium sporogenes]|uniref:putative glycolipid-binding domain-containing protein n=1 Tax=Clostridium sporogenes TaxID=1509 RepID=UPI0022381DD6|nr:putative glycolipid-binding domain-containing protein [Clostridium sporogenes]MCW6061125.1 putative glycolipid-binding domain-containing protein [Clostridium sporogenes]